MLNFSLRKEINKKKKIYNNNKQNRSIIIIDYHIHSPKIKFYHDINIYIYNIASLYFIT